ncbi:MAG: Undecaprenyl-phosphate mannosyltransferase [Sediminibacterium sp.]|nr:Undecaprenyl-phosphate mannosyltransferase [Sediminibacterium sp.]
MNIIPSNPNNPDCRIGIFVIAYNAESHIEKTLSRIPESVWKMLTVVYIIDDCSSDETTLKALGFNNEYSGKIVVIRNRVNLRYGGNQKLGYQWAIDQQLDIVVMLHADGQYAPEFLEQMYTPIMKNEADVVIGSRMMTAKTALLGGMPKYKYYGNIILTKMQIALTGLRLSEYHSGYRAYSVKFLKSIPFWENSNEWHFDTQILVQNYQNKARIRELPIPTYYGDEICRVNGMSYAFNCVITSFGFLLYRRGIYYSRKYDVNLKGQRYFDKFDDPYSSHSLIYKYLLSHGVEGKKVLELGVGDASLTRRLKANGALVDGVESDRVYIELAQPYCKNIFSGDLNKIETLNLDTDYDIIVAADILEHLVDPEYVLSKLKTNLKKDGLLVVSLPNVANIYVRMSLLFGRFNYHSKGLLDKTHLHFYTISTASSMLAKTGWKITDKNVTAIPLAIVFPFLRMKAFRWILQLFYGITRLFKGLFAYQSLSYCTNPNSTTLL